MHCKGQVFLSEIMQSALLMRQVLKPPCHLLTFVLKIFTDFAEIRQEIEAETERSSGDNKVRRKA